MWEILQDNPVSSTNKLYRKETVHLQKEGAVANY